MTPSRSSTLMLAAIAAIASIDLIFLVAFKVRQPWGIPVFAILWAIGATLWRWYQERNTR